MPTTLLAQRALLHFVGAAVVCLVATDAFAQDEEDILVESEDENEDTVSDQSLALETFTDTVGSDDDMQRTRFNVRFTTEVHTRDNADFRLADETSIDTVEQTDDRSTFGYSALSATVEHDVSDEVTLSISPIYGGAWGSDQIVRFDQSSATVFGLGQMFVDYHPQVSSDIDLSLRIGRQRFSIGGVPRDFVLNDDLDAVVGNFAIPNVFGARVLFLDMYRGNDIPDMVYRIDDTGQATTQGMRGQTNTYRTGLVLHEAGDDDSALSWRAYGFFAKIGGDRDGTGADISNGGVPGGNFSDNDWNAIFGARVAYELDVTDGLAITPYAEFSRSAGIDRKRADQRDVDAEGNAFGVGVVAEYDRNSVRANVAVDFYHFDGPDYASDGLQFSHGFVGFRGSRIGGFGLDNHMGWSPSSYISSGGVRETTHDNQLRASGVQSLHFGVGGGYGAFSLDLDAYLLNDTANTFLFDDGEPDFDTLPRPFGYSDADLRAQERLGLSLGTELDAAITAQATENLNFYLVYTTFQPGEFYEVEFEFADRNLGTAYAGTEPFWALFGGTRLEF